MNVWVGFHMNITTILHKVSKAHSVEFCCTAWLLIRNQMIFATNNNMFIILYICRFMRLSFEAFSRRKEYNNLAKY